MKYFYFPFMDGLFYSLRVTTKVQLLCMNEDIPWSWCCTVMSLPKWLNFHSLNKGITCSIRSTFSTWRQTSFWSNDYTKFYLRMGNPLQQGRNRISISKSNIHIESVPTKAAFRYMSKITRTQNLGVSRWCSTFSASIGRLLQVSLWVTRHDRSLITLFWLPIYTSKASHAHSPVLWWQDTQDFSVCVMPDTDAPYGFSFVVY